MLEEGSAVEGLGSGQARQWGDHGCKRAVGEMRGLMVGVATAMGRKRGGMS